MWGLCQTIWKWRDVGLARVQGTESALDEPDGWFIQQFRVPFAKPDDLAFELFKTCSARNQCALEPVWIIIVVEFLRAFVHLHGTQASKKTAHILPTIARLAGKSVFWVRQLLIGGKLAKRKKITPGFNPRTGKTRLDRGTEQ